MTAAPPPELKLVGFSEPVISQRCAVTIPTGMSSNTFLGARDSVILNSSLQRLLSEELTLESGTYHQYLHKVCNLKNHQ